MSKTIDEKVVSLEFDNSQFESNVKTSLSTLDKLKAALKFDGANKGLREIEEASKTIDFSPMEKGLDRVADKFNVLSTIERTVITNLTNRIVDAGIKLSKSVSIDQVASGWTKMDDMTSSVQSLVNSTGKSVEQVNKWLEKLMWFSDETSFGFTDMTSALATMASSGGDVEKLIPMIEGIANATAYAGKGAAEFSRVIYNLNQSYSAGYLNYQDWKSVQLAGASSKALQETLIKSAEELGKIKKGTIDVNNFTSSLKEKWADTEVMELAFNKFAAMTEAAYKGIDEGLFQNATEAYEALADSFDEYSSRAALSAQEAKSFKEAVDATADAASTKWMQMFSTIFGNYTQQKETWTNVVGDLYELFVTPIDKLVEVTKKAFDNNPVDLFKKSLEDVGIETENLDDKFIDFVKRTGDLSGKMNPEVFASNVDVLYKKYGSLNKLASSGEINLKQYFSAFLDSLAAGETTVNGITGGLEEIQKVYDSIWKGDFGNGAERVKKLTEAGYDYATMQNLINTMSKKGHRSGYKITADDIKELSEAELANIGYTEEQIKMLKELADQSTESGQSMQELINSMGKKSGREYLSESISNFLNVLVNIRERISEVWKELFQVDASGILYKITESIWSFSNVLVDATEKGSPFEKFIRVIGSAFKLVSTIINSVVKGAFNGLKKIFSSLNIDTSKLSDGLSGILDKISTWLQDSNFLTKGLEDLGGAISGIIDKVKEWVTNFVDLDKASQIAQKFGGTFKDIIDEIKIDSKANIFANITNNLSDFASTVKKDGISTFELFGNKIGTFSAVIGKTVGDGATSFINFIKKIGTPFKITDEQFEELKEKARTLTETLIGIGGGYLVLNSINSLATALGNLVSPFKTIVNIGTTVNGTIKSVGQYFDALKNEVKAREFSTNLLKIALGVGLLVGSLFMMANIGKEGSLWTAILAMAALAAIVGGLAIAFAHASSIGGDATDFTVNILALAVGLVAISKAIKAFDDIKNPLQTFMLVIGTLMGLVVAANLLKKSASGFGANLGKLLEMSAALLVMSLALKMMDSIDVERVDKTLATMIICITSLVIIGNLAKGLGKDFGAGIILASLSLFILIKALKEIAEIPVDTYLQGILALFPLISYISILLLACKTTSKEAATVSVSILALSLAIKTLTKSIKTLGEMDPATVIKGGIAVSALLTVLALISKYIAATTKGSGTWKQALAASTYMITMCGVIYLLAGAILIFKNLDTAGLFKAVGAISVLVLSFGLMVNLMKDNNFTASTTTSLGKIAIIIGILAAAVGILSFIPWESLLAATTSMVAIILALGVMCKSLLTLGTAMNNGKILTIVLSLSAFIAAITGCIYLLAKIENPDAALKAALGIAAVLTAVGVCAQLLMNAGVLASVGGMTGATQVLALIGIMAAVIEGIGYLITKIPGSLDTLDQIVDVMTKVGAAIGGFFGSIVGGLVGGSMKAVSDALPAVAENLSSFMTNLSGFITGVQSLNGGLTDISTLVDIIITMGSFKFTNAIMTLSNDQKLVENMSNFFDKFGTAITEFSEKISGKVDTASVEAASNAGLMMAELANSIPKEGGIISKWFTGSSDIAAFGDDMVHFGEQLVKLSNTMSDGEFSQDNVEKAEKAGETMAAIFNSLPSQGGFLQKIIGEKNLGSFGDQLYDLACGLYDMNDVMKLTDFSEASVEQAKNAGAMIDAIVTALPEESSLKSSILGGSQNIGDFAADISELSTAFISLSDVFSEGSSFTPQVVEQASSAGSILAGLANALPENKGIFSSTKDLGDFGKQLKDLGKGLKGFAEEIGTDTVFPSDSQNLSMFNTTKKLIDIGKYAKDQGDGFGRNITSLGANLKGFGKDLEKFMSSMLFYDDSKVQSVLQSINQMFGINIIETITNSYSGVEDTGKGTVNSFNLGLKDSEKNENVKKSSGSIIDNVINILAKGKDLALQKGKDILDGLMEGLKDPTKQEGIKQIGRNTYISFEQGYKEAADINSPSREAMKLGKFSVDGLAIGVKENLGELTIAGSKTGSTLLTAMRDSLAAANAVLDSELHPTITPVLDLTTLTYQTGGISQLLNNSKAFGLSGSIGIQNGRKTGSENTITVNNTFDISNGGDIDRETVRSWSRWIADDLNEELGRRI